jgi:hypothetical protein
MKPLTKYCLLALLLPALLLFQVACTPSQVVSLLGNVADAAAVAIPLLGGSLPPEVRAQIASYLAAVSQACSQTSTLLAASGGKIDPAMISQIVGMFAAIVVPGLPPGLPQTIAMAVQAVAAAVASFLAQIQPHTVGGGQNRTQEVERPQQAQAQAAVLKVSHGDRARLAKVKAQADATVLAVRRLGY